MWPYGYGGGWGWMAAGWIMMVAFWVLVIAGAVVAVRWMNTRGGDGRLPETPLEILRRRYAAGELTKEQFESMKRDVA
ncbi:MAG TPA: SHOCT domain-containing protein [bacterium]|nr:SHOCT domain-containing protein [bacterium]